MGSLFDGIGGFPLAAVRNGITPVWASEIEAFPIEVTKLRFPGMIHVGDITKLHGAELPPVDIICGGSPCQDLSVAGARAGLVGARSGLFMEQMRIVREMRLAEKARGRESVNIRPRWMCWENVPYALQHINDVTSRADRTPRSWPSAPATSLPVPAWSCWRMSAVRSPPQKSSRTLSHGC